MIVVRAELDRRPFELGEVTFFGYRASATSCFIAEILPRAPTTRSVASRNSGLGMRRPPSTL